MTRWYLLAVALILIIIGIFAFLSAGLHRTSAPQDNRHPVPIPTSASTTPFGIPPNVAPHVNADSHEPQPAAFQWIPISNEPILFSQKNDVAYFDRIPFPSDADIRALVVAKSATSLAPYAKDSRHVYYIDRFQTQRDDLLSSTSTTIPIIQSADPNTFSVLYSNSDYGEYISFALDKDSLYQGDHHIVNAHQIDKSSFIIFTDYRGLAQYWAKDKYHVYDILRHEQQSTSSSPIVLGADAATFAPIFLAGKYTAFAKDRSHVFYAGPTYHTMVLASANPTTFTILDTEYSKDSTNAWFMDKLIRGADSSSFKVLNTGSFTMSHYAQDIKNVYIDGASIAGADSASFQSLPVHGLSIYFKDKTHVFYESGYGSIEVVTGADPKTFMTVAHQAYDGEDAQHRYFAGKAL